MEEVEIKRKVFEVIETLGEYSKKVSRKGKIYFLKEFKDAKEFNEVIDGANNLKHSGVTIPDVYMYDKNKLVLVTDFIEGNTIADELMNGDLKEEIYEAAFKTNWYLKGGKLSITFLPQYFKFVNGKLYYLYLKTTNFDPKLSLENKYIWYWFYTKEFVKYLNENSLPVDNQRANVDNGLLNKNIALTVVKFYK